MFNSSLLKPIIIIFFALLLQSCAVRSVYVPVSQNVPLFDTNTSLKSTAYIGANHVELQAACNPGKHLAIATNINFGSGWGVYDAATGFYGCNSSGKIRYEVFSGYGYNSNSSYQKNPLVLFRNRGIDYEVSSIYHKFYLQPAIGFAGKINMYKIDYTFSLSCRTSLNYFEDFTYREIDRVNSTNLEDPVYRVNKNYKNKTLFLFEPCITNKVGIKNIYAVLQLQVMTPYSQQIDVHNTKFSQGVLLSIGFQYDLKFNKL